MNSKKIIIFKNDVLFDILHEIGETFKFDLIKANDENLEEIKKKSGANLLIISVIDNLKFKNELIIDKTPIKLWKLLELINLKFLKIKFKSQSIFKIGTYNINLNSRQMSKDKFFLDLTEREINLIIFLKESFNAVKVEKLQKEVWAYGSHLETHTVETHIYRLRKKIKEKFGDENFILSLKEGYLIN